MCYFGEVSIFILQKVLRPVNHRQKPRNSIPNFFKEFRSRSFFDCVCYCKDNIIKNHVDHLTLGAFKQMIYILLEAHFLVKHKKVF